MEDQNEVDVENVLTGIVRDLVQDWGIETEDIGGSTKLAADLEFASVDIIQLCMAIEQHYDRKLGFNKMLMKDGSYVSDISIAQVAAFVTEALKEVD